MKKKIEKIKVYRPIEGWRNSDRLEIIETNVYRLIGGINRIIAHLNKQE